MMIYLSHKIDFILAIWYSIYVQWTKRVWRLIILQLKKWTSYKYSFIYMCFKSRMKEWRNVGSQKNSSGGELCSDR